MFKLVATPPLLITEFAKAAANFTFPFTYLTEIWLAKISTLGVQEQKHHVSILHHDKLSWKVSKKGEKLMKGPKWFQPFQINPVLYTDVNIVITMGYFDF